MLHGILVLALLFLVGCGGGSGRMVQMPTPMTPVAQPEPKPEPAPEPTPTPEPTPDPTPDPDPEPQPVLDETGASTKGNEPYQVLGSTPPRTVYLNIFNEWGFWARQEDRTLFKVYLQGEWPIVRAFIEGSPTGSNPTSALGSATWRGNVRASGFGGSPPITGDARLQMDIDAATIDVFLTNFTDNNADMSWNDLSVTNGAFRDSGGTFLEPETIEGAFYGSTHQGVAGKFERDGMKGLFGALRE